MFSDTVVNAIWLKTITTSIWINWRSSQSSVLLQAVACKKCLKRRMRNRGCRKPLSSPPVTDSLRISCAKICIRTIVSNSHQWVYPHKFPPLFFNSFYAVASTTSCGNEFHTPIKKLCGKSISFRLNWIVSFGASLFMYCEKSRRILLYKCSLWHLSFCGLLTYSLNILLLFVFFISLFLWYLISFSCLPEPCKVLLKKPETNLI